jgi:release factor glutamine methyltransferase
MAMDAEPERLEPVRSLIRTAARALEAAGVESAQLDAELLMAEAADVTRARLLADSVPLSAAALARFDAYVARRAGREPLAYITGRKEFFSLEFAVTPAVLIPRPETETIVAGALRAIAPRPAARVLDLGTGSGAIAIAIAANAPHARIVATDISKAALEVARASAVRLRVADRIEFRPGDCWQALEDPKLRFDLIVSNPPYIEAAAIPHLAPEIRDFEPGIAVVSGADGLEFYRRILGGARAFSAPRAELMVEIGAGQAEAVFRICHEAGCSEAESIRDLAGIERVIRARW